jgi:hypothetical protein
MLSEQIPGLLYFWLKCILSKMIKECVREEILGVRIPYMIFVPRVESRHVAGVPINRGHTFLLEWWLTFSTALPHWLDWCCYHVGLASTHSEWGVALLGW